MVNLILKINRNTETKLVRFITGSHYRGHTAKLFTDNNTLKIDEIYFYIHVVSILMYKFRTKELPKEFYCMFTSTKTFIYTIPDNMKITVSQYTIKFAKKKQIRYQDVACNDIAKQI